LKTPKIGVWDIEASGLNANGGFIICASVVDPHTMKVKTFRIDKYKGYRKDTWNDSQLVEDLVAYLNSLDIWVTFYGTRFDLPFVNTRVLYWNAQGATIPFLANVPHVDVHRTARNKLKLHSNRLASVLELLGRGEKTPLDLPVWIRAAGGHKPSLNYIVEHCEVDAKRTAEAYLDLLPLIQAHPNVGLLLGGRVSCSNCGSDKVQKRGQYVTAAAKRQRYACNECGHWSSVPFRAELKEAPSVAVKKKQ
jgi:DNA polymerase elongation subunit (family B)